MCLFMKSKNVRASGECPVDEWIKSTRLVREWEDMKREIALHKYYESEKVGHDIGWERATVDWMIHFGCKRP
jgi:hypothetical protein